MDAAFVFKYRGAKRSLTLDFERCTLEELGAHLHELTATHFPTQKLIGPNIKGVLKLAENPSSTLQAAGLLPDKPYTLMGSPLEAVHQVQAQKDVRQIRGFDEELEREAKRRTYGTPSVKPPDVEYSFESYEVLERPGLHPPPSRAKALLYRLANDAGIIGIMQKHRWRVGLLSEMPPEGKVGVSQVCVLGYNVNKGQEIALRLRTDDLKGFRKYTVIKNTLIHELTHMVWSDHDDNFKKLNSQLLKEYDDLLHRSQGGIVLDSAAAGDDDYDLTAAPVDGHFLGGMASHRDPASAAREAALRREAASKARRDERS